METYTLIIWITLAGKTEITKIKGLTEDQCFRREMSIALQIDPDIVATKCEPERPSYAICLPDMPCWG
ncbi:MAG: hypothetical protein EHM35_01165 [Planctomycetaceae bacterium]|nr:MAG: hypothetical protein EHM35_01165 [Planctomycetaceae bacterium]